MENQNKRTRTTVQASIVIDENFQDPNKPEHPRRPPQYELLKATDPNHRLIVQYHEAQKKYNEYWIKARPPKEQEPKQELKKLVEIDFVYLYGMFRTAYKLANGIYFDPEYNDGEPKIFVFTLMYFIFKSEKFYDSPLLNKEINTASLKKGLMVIGGYGCGKTSIFKAFRYLFFESERNEEILIKDVDGDKVPLKRYRKLFFAFFPVNDVVKDYEACSTAEEKSRFWQVMEKGNHYYDDLMKERQASNYGKIELFQDILETRYEKRCMTMASLNYVGKTVKNTLDEIEKKYGPRVYDRVFEQFNIVELKGKSLRK